MATVRGAKWPFTQATFWLSLGFNNKNPFDSIEKTWGGCGYREDIWSNFRNIVFETLLMHGVVSNRRAWKGKRIVTLIFQVCYAQKTLELTIFQ